LELLFYAFW